MKNKKGGRPKKSAAQKLKYHVLVKLCTQDFYTLKAQAKEAGISPTEFARLAIIGAEIKPRMTPEEAGHIRNLSGMGNNLNQIAHKANAAGYQAARGEYLDLAPKIDELLNRLLYDR